MATLLKTKRRINSIASTRKITNAMELVASVKFKRYKNIMANNFAYVNNIREVLSYLQSLIKRDENEAIIFNKNKKRLFIIINSNLGLCASYNNDIFKYATNLLNKDDDILPIGLKGFNHFKDLSFKINDQYVSLNEKINFDDVNKFSSFIISTYLNKTYNEIHLIYTDYINSITYKPKDITLLPLINNKKSQENLLPPIIEPDANTLFNELLPIYVASELYQGIIISEVSEQSSRRNAMENATDNADEMLDKLKLEYNKARQSAITQEISEVVSGANNLN